jgi:hypothetical protein
MLTRGYFGTMAELNAAMELFGFKTTLVQETLSSKQFTVYNMGDAGCEHHFYLLFTGHSDGGHFQKLDLLSGGESIPAGKFQLAQNPGQDPTGITISRIEQKDSQLTTEPGVKRMLETEPNQESNKRAKDECTNSRHCAEVPLRGVNSTSDEAIYSNVESLNLWPSFSSDLSVVAEINTAPDSACSPDVTLPSLGAPSSNDSNVSYYLVFLPPWTETSLQKALEPMVVEVQEKCFALVDCNNVQGARSLNLRRGNFVIELDDLYKIKNVTDKGICIKFRHA